MKVPTTVVAGGGRNPITIDCGTHSLGEGDTLTIVLPDVPVVMEVGGKPQRFLLRGKWYRVGEEIEP
jgi:hypothetical protein